jgi:hypothetical protein
MSEKDVTSTDTTTTPQENTTPPTSGASSEKPVWEETLAETMERVQKMIIENLKNPANHSDYREYPGDK